MGKGRKKEQRKQTIKLLKQIRKHPGWWDIICNPDDENMTIATMKMLVEQLQKESLHQIVFVLLTLHRKEERIDTLSKVLSLELITEAWERGEKASINNRTESYIT